MANIVRIDLKCEQTVKIENKEFIYGNKANIAEVYIACDGISAWIGSVDNYEDLLKLAGPENLEEVLSETLSEDEYNVIEAALFCSNYKYMIGNDWFTMIIH